MPKIGQPERLEVLALNSSLIWLCSAGEKLMPLIGSHVDWKEPLNRLTDYMQSIFEYSVPVEYYDDMSLKLFREIEKMIEKIKRNLDIRATMDKYLGQVHIAVSLAKVLLSSKLRRLRIEDMPKMMRQVFCPHMDKLKGLHYFSLGSMSGGFLNLEVEGVLQKGIASMGNLVSLTLNYDCTDNILRSLVRHCPNIQFVDFTNSKSITNDSIDLLIKLTKLRVALLQRTQVSIAGMINLLMYANNLIDVGKYDDLGRALEFIADFQSNKGSLKLRKFDSKITTTRHLQILAEKCPDMEHVSVFHDVMNTDLMALVGINKLSELRLLACDFFGDQVRNMLELKGCNITYLHLEHVEQLDMNALMYISQFCPDLKVLSMCNCVLIQSTSLYTRRLPLPPFFNLEQLVFIAQGPLLNLEFIIGYAFKIKHISIGSRAQTTDSFWNSIFMRNPLQNLETVRIMNSEDLSIQTAYKFIVNCPNLAKLNELEYWKRVKESDIDDLKQLIKERNYDVDIKPCRGNLPAYLR